MRLRSAKQYQRAWWVLNRPLHPFSDPSEWPHDAVVRRGISLDRGVADLVEWIWSQGVETFNSCEGDPTLERLSRHAIAYENPYLAIITFGTIADARWFASLIATVEERHPAADPAGRPATIKFTPVPASQEYFHVSFSPATLLHDELIEEIASADFAGRT